MSTSPLFSDEMKLTFDSQVLAVLENTSDGFIILNNCWCYTYLNRAAETILQKRREDILGKNVWEVFPEAVGTSFWTKFYEAANTQTIVEFEDFYPPLVKWFQVHIYPSEAGLSVTLQDITERKHSAEDARLQLAALVESSNDAIIGKTREGIITSWNRAAERMYGYSAEEAVGRPITLIFPPDRQDEFTKIMEQILRGERVDHYETTRMRKDGTILPVSITVSPIHNKDGQIIGASAIAQDITSRKRAEEQAHFLANVSKVLASTLDYQETLANIAHLVVPQLADWFIADLVDEHGHFELIEVDHRDPEKVQWAKELRKKYPIDPDAPTGVPNVVRTGQAELYSEITDDMLVASARDEEELAISRQIGFTSVMIVPLVARGKTPGVITFVSAESGRRYNIADIALAEEVGRRVGVALDNAILYRQVQQSRDQLDVILRGVADGITVHGVYRSADGGSTWTAAGLAGSDRIGRLAIDPTNPNRIFAAATGSLFVPGGVRGLYRTTDAGATWQLVLPGGNGTTGAIDVAIDPRNPNRIFAAMWDHKRQPEGRTYGGVGSGLFRSTDGGTTWSRIAGGLPAASSNLGRMGVAIAPGNSNRMYAIAADTTGNFAGFWTSTNGGTAWTSITNTSFLSASQSTYGWWFGRIWVDAAAEQHLWVAGVQMLESSNAGGSWTRNTTVHADQHAFAFDPRVAGRVFLGNDGGVYRSTSNGSLTGTWTKATSLGINQFYTVAVSRQDTARVSGGAQDNGSLRNWSGTAFNAIGGGDGTTNLIDPTNQNKVYSCSQNGECTRSTDGGTTRSGFGSTVSDRRNWVTPIVFDPNNPAIMYYAGNRVNRSTSSAASWTAISPDLTRGNGGIGGAFGTITTLAVARSDSRVIYAGTDDGRAWITRNTGGSWTEITAGLPTRWITHIEVDPANANIAYLSVSGYRNGDSRAHVFKTTTGGTGSAAWQDISAGLPDAPVNDVVLDPRNSGVLYAATDVGVFGRTGGVWARVGSGLPLVPVADLDAVAAGATTVLTAATYGLGFYRTTA